ncbi:ATP-binding protein [Actinomadura chibensis]|uniref:ATP-binding protein n=1 Tax=Actinomadura chibensis TaxID=392828 RepID=A0A5D0NXS6_9ACTN|nr:ATP-binding protein [Actinomadura chibensis]
MGAKVASVGELDISCSAGRAVSRRVRGLVERRLLEWGLSTVVDDVVLVVGELVANAVESTPGEEIRVRFARDGGCVVVAVWDSSGHLPVLRPVVEVDDVRPDPCALEPGHEEGGRGLQIVRALASGYGVTMTRPVGKWVWAEISC